MQNFGYAALQVIPSMKGAAKTLDSELNGSMSKAGGKAGNSASKGIVTGVKGAIGKAGKIIGGTVLATGAAITAIAVKGGLSRALNIEDAKASLAGLGHDTKSVTKIMDNASASVKGTAFGLGEAAGVAAGAVAAGIKPGIALEKNLKLVGDAATIAKTDMGSMGAIFNKVATSNKVQGEVLAQLGDRGIPIVQLLSKEMGKSAEEVTKLASKGKIDFATFSKAMESGMGGAALKSGETFRGAMKNTYAALGRVGETVMTPFLDTIKTGFNAAMPAIDAFNAAIKPFMETFGKWLGSVAPPLFAKLSTGAINLFKNMNPEAISAKWAALQTKFAPVFSVFSKIGTAAKTGIGAAKEAITDLFLGFKVPKIDATGMAPDLSIFVGIGAKIRTAFDSLAPVGSAVATAFAPLLDTIKQIGPQILTTATQFSPLGIVIKALTPLLPVIGTALAEIGSALGGALAQVLPQVVGLWQELGGVLSGTLASMLPTIAGVITQLASAAASLLPPLIGIAGAIAGQLVGAVSAILPSLGMLVTQLMSALLPVLPQITTSLTMVATTVGTLLSGALGAVLPLLGQLVAQVVTSLVPMMPVIAQLFATVATVVAALAQALVPLLPPIMELAQTVFVALAGILPPVIGLITTVAGVVVQLVTALTPLLPTIGNLIGAGISVLTAVLTPLIHIIAGVANVVVTVLSVALQLIMPIISGVIGIVTSVAQVLSGVLTGAVQLAASVVTSTFNAIAAITGSVWNSVSSVISGAISVVSGAVSGGFNFVRSLITSVWSSVQTATAGAMSAVSGAVSDGLATVVRFFTELPGKVVGSLSGLAGQLSTVGSQMIQGLIGGIGDMANAAIGKVKEVVGGALNAAKSLLGIQSPSRVFRDEVGKMIPRGLAAGIVADKGKAVDAIKKLSDAITKASETSLKAETKRLQEARRKQNKKISDYNKSLSKKKGSSLGAISAADAKKIATNKLGVKASKKAIAAEAKAIQAARRKTNKGISAQNKKLGSKKKDSLGALSAADAEKQAKKNLAAQQAAAKSAKKMIDAQAKTTAALWKNGSGKGTDALLASFAKNGNLRAAASGAARNATLTDIAKARETVAVRLDKANEKLGKMLDMRDSIKSSIMGELDLKIDKTDLGVSAGFGAVAGKVKALATKAKAFAGKLKRLAQRGIPTGLVQEIAGYGTVEGSQVADALLSGSNKQIKELKADYGSLTHWSGEAGRHVTEQFFGIGLDAQREIINGLKADDAKLVAAAKHLTSKLTKAVKKELGIKSPSRVWRDQIGRMLPAGMVAGIDAGRSKVEAAVRLLGAPLNSVADVELALQGPRITTPKINNTDTGLSQANIDELLRAIEALADRPIEVPVNIDSKEIARANTKGRRELRLPPTSTRG